jgi:hypothetical protein
VDGPGTTARVHGDQYQLRAGRLITAVGEEEPTLADIGDWLAQLAEAAIAVHALDADSHPWNYGTYNDVASLGTPPWSRVPEAWTKALRIVQGPRPEGRRCFIHRDYHPTNVLWQDGRVSGVVDWVNACRGAPNFDIAHCRWNLVGLLGVDAADRFLHAYQRAAGDAFVYEPYWDLAALIEMLPGPPEVYDGWTALGVRHLTGGLLLERTDAYVASIVARC